MKTEVGSVSWIRFEKLANLHEKYRICPLGDAGVGAESCELRRDYLRSAKQRRRDGSCILRREESKEFIRLRMTEQD